MYTFCLNNPIIYIDPSGHFTLEEQEAMLLEHEFEMGMGGYKITPLSNINSPEMTALKVTYANFIMSNDTSGADAVMRTMQSYDPSISYNFSSSKKTVNVAISKVDKITESSLKGDKVMREGIVAIASLAHPLLGFCISSGLQAEYNGGSITFNEILMDVVDTGIGAVGLFGKAYTVGKAIFDVKYENHEYMTYNEDILRLGDVLVKISVRSSQGRNNMTKSVIIRTDGSIKVYSAGWYGDEPMTEPFWDQSIMKGWEQDGND